MATFYLDLEGGNDANDGTSFANRWKTLQSGATAARTAPGDTIRVMASSDPVAIGQSATWSNSGTSLTLASAVTQIIENCETAWTASANVTCFAYGSDMAVGTYSALSQIAAGFTTGKVSYSAISSLDLSGYKQISFWIQSSTAQAAGVFQIKLCSDAAGATPVDTLDIPALDAGKWSVVTIDKGSALGSAIQSVALYAVSDPGTVNIYLDHIIACKDSASADAITLRSLIGKNNGTNEPWMAIRSISGTTVNFMAIDSNSMPMATKYYGSSETVPAYRREAITITNTMIPQEAGTLDSQITYSCGWDRSAMTSQNSETWVRGIGAVAAFNNNLEVSYIKVEKLFGVSLAINTFYSGTGVGMEFSDCGAVAGAFGLHVYSGGQAMVDFRYMASCRNGLLCSSEKALRGSRCRIGKIWGASPALTAYALQGGGWEAVPFHVDEIKGFYYAVQGFTGIRLYGTTFADAGGGYDIFTMNGNLPIYLFGCTNSGQLNTNLITYSHDDGGVQGSHKITYLTYGTIQTATDQRYTASGKSWKFSPTLSTMGKYSPLVLRVATVVVRAGVPTTVKLWCRRSNTGLTMKLLCRGGQVAGVTSDVSSSMSAAADTWEQVSIAFTPTADGIVDIEAQAYGGTTYNGWVDDLSVNFG